MFRAPSGPAAREARASLRSAPRLEARPCPPVPPAPSTPAALYRCAWPGASARCPATLPSGPSGALHSCGVVVIDADRPARSPSALRASLGASFPMSGQAPPPTDAVAIPVGLAAVSILAVLGMDAPKVQTTSVKLSEFGVFWARWSAIWAHCGRDCDERGNGGHLRGPLQVGGERTMCRCGSNPVPGYVR